jgi:hypothetical protein
MTADLWREDAQGLWQSQECVVTQMSVDEMRTRAARWDREFRATNWIAFACAGVFALFFGWMLVVTHTMLQRIGATMGLAAAAYLVFLGTWIASHRWTEDGATCIRAYKRQLERRRMADLGSARILLLSMTGCALLSESGPWAPWTLTAATQLAAGILAYVYFSRQSGRFQARVEELDRLERAAASF